MMDTLPGSTRILGDGFRHIAKMEAAGAGMPKIQRMPQEHRKPSVPRQPRPPLAERPQGEARQGSTFMGDALEMKRQVADIYTAVRALRQQSIKTRILVPPQDTRLRTAEGRRQADLVAGVELVSHKQSSGW